jgi:hypothetical protein
VAGAARFQSHAAHQLVDVVAEEWTDEIAFRACGKDVRCPRVDAVDLAFHLGDGGQLQLAAEALR